MQKHVQKVLEEEKDVFNFNIAVIQKELNSNVLTFIDNTNEHICKLLKDNKIEITKKEVNRIIFKAFNFRLAELNVNFVRYLTSKRKSIIDDFINSKQIPDIDIEKDEEILSILDNLKCYNEIDALVNVLENNYKLDDLTQFKKVIYRYNDNFYDNISKLIFKTFNSLIKYLKDLMIEDDDTIISYIINHTNKMIYFKINKALETEKESILSQSLNYKKEMIGALESIVPKDNKVEIINYLNSNYTNIVNLVYSKYSDYIVNEVNKIVVNFKGKSLKDLENIEKPFFELAQKNARTKNMDSEQINEPILYNLVVKMFGSYSVEDYEKVRLLLNDYMNELNLIMLEKIEQIPNIIVDIAIKEKKQSLDIIKNVEMKKISKEVLMEKFKEKELYDKNLSSDDFRI